MQTINLNQQIIITLTPYGKTIFQTFHKALTKKELTTDLNVPITISLWEFSQIFGPYLYNGNPNIVVVDNEIMIK